MRGGSRHARSLTNQLTHTGKSSRFSTQGMPATEIRARGEQEPVVKVAEAKAVAAAPVAKEAHGDSIWTRSAWTIGAGLVFGLSLHKAGVFRPDVLLNQFHLPDFAKSDNVREFVLVTELLCATSLRTRTARAVFFHPAVDAGDLPVGLCNEYACHGGDAVDSVTR